MIRAHNNNVFLKGLLLLFMFLQTVLSFGQIPKDSILSKEVLTKDLYLLKDALLKSHENPFTYCTEAEAEASLIEATEAIEEGATYYQFIRVLGKYLGVFKDSHTSINFDALISYMEDQQEYILNMRVRFIENEIYILEDREEKLSSGLQLKTINGQSADSLFNLVKEFSVQEGNSVQPKDRIAEALFGNFINLVCDFKETNTLELYDPVKEEQLKVNYKGVQISELRARNAKNRKKIPPYSLEFKNGDSLAWIKVKSFGGASSRKYYRFLNKTYREIRKVNPSEIVVDLRNNTGGLINRAESLFQLFSEEGSVMPTNIIANQSELSLSYYNAKHKGLNRWFIDHFNKRNKRVQNHRTIINLAEGERDTVYYEALNRLKHGALKGDKYVLMNGLSGSSSVLFLSNFKRQNVGLLVGEECLGPLTGTWGNATNVHLRGSGVNVLMSILRTNTDNNFKVDPEPIHPDWRVEPSVDDLYHEKDPFEEMFKGDQRNIRLLRRLGN